jgi:ferredoxin
MLKVNDTCIGCGACVAIAPENFDYAEGVSVVTNETITEKTKEAVDACPVGAIEVEEATTEAAE